MTKLDNDIETHVPLVQEVSSSAEAARGTRNAVHQQIHCEVVYVAPGVSRSPDQTTPVQCIPLERPFLFP